MARAHGQRYVDFLVGRPGPRDPALGRQGLEEDLRRLGDELGAALLPESAGERLGELLDQTGVGETVEKGTLFFCTLCARRRAPNDKSPTLPVWLVVQSFIDDFSNTSALAFGGRRLR